MKYRKKPIVVDAEEYRLGMEDGFAKGLPYVETLEGRMIIRSGDYVVTGVDGERYPVKRSIFRKSFVPIEVEKNTNGRFSHLPFAMRFGLVVALVFVVVFVQHVLHPAPG